MEKRGCSSIAPIGFSKFFSVHAHLNFGFSIDAAVSARVEVRTGPS